MNFNFPLLRQNTISVSKELSVDEANKAEILGDPDFRFQILREGSNEPFIGSGVSYDILDADRKVIGSGTLPPRIPENFSVREVFGTFNPVE